MEWLIAFAFIALAWLALRAGLALARLRVRYEQQRREAADEFFEVSEGLLTEENLPETMIQTIEELNATINRPHTPYFLFRAMSDRRKGKLSDQEIVKTSEDFWADIAKDPKLRDTTNTLFGTWFTAVTAMSITVGPLARSLATQKSIPPAARTASSRIRETNHKHDNMAHAV